MNAACPCKVCGEPGHIPRKCPVLYEMLKEGFYSGGGGGGGHSHDDDEKVNDQGEHEKVPAP